MRITYQPTYGVSRHVDPISPEEAAAIVISRAGALCDGQLERAQASTDAAAEMLGRLVAVLIGNGTLRTAEQVERVLGYYELKVED